MVILTSRQKVKVFSKNSKTVRFENNQGIQFSYADLDEHLSLQAERCDGYLRCHNVSWLVELKGRHVEKAIEQIISTSSLLKDELKGSKLVPVIVAKTCPKATIAAKLLSKLKNECGVEVSSNIRLKTASLVIDLSDPKA